MPASMTATRPVSTPMAVTRVAVNMATRSTWTESHVAVSQVYDYTFYFYFFSYVEHKCVVTQNDDGGAYCVVVN